MTIQMKDLVDRYNGLKEELNNIVIDNEVSIESIEAALSMLKFIENTLYMTADIISEKGE